MPQISDDPIRRVIDRRIPWAIHSEVYSQQCFGTGPAPDQGWKLHVAATPDSALDVLEPALDVLFAEGVRFKVASSLNVLSALNAGNFGISQIGKFIAVYPSDDAQAVGLSLKLDEVTRGRRGPRVPSDRPLRPDSLVHYRYGSIRLRSEAEGPDGGETGAYELLDSEGRLTSDVRVNFYVPPSDVADPFEASGAYVPQPTRSTLMNGRYLVIDALSQSPRGGVFRAVDLESQPARICLLKESWHDVSPDQNGRDARDWAANEERILRRHANDPLLPSFYESFELAGDHYMAIEYVAGIPLDRVLADKYPHADKVDPADVVSIGLATADLIARLHSIGLVFRDFKPENVIATPDGGYRLVDFGLAYDYVADGGPALGGGTPYFCPPEQFDGREAAPADDVFAWGAVLHYLACGVASLAGTPESVNRQTPLQRKPVSELNRGFPASIGAVIDRAAAWDRSHRYATMIEARNALEQAARKLETAPAHAPTVGSKNPDEPLAAVAPVQVTSAEALHLAREVGDALCAAAEERDGGLCWATRIELNERLQRSPDLYAGASGIGLFLAELAHTTGETRYAEAARGAARWLTGPLWGRGWAQHGLHGGEPGVAYFLLRLAELLGEPDYIVAAEMRLRRLRNTPFVTVDLMHGAAGTILALLRVHAITGEAGFLRDARAAGDELVRAALPAPKGKSGCYWQVAEAALGVTSAPYLGLLHGAAGIGLALAQLGAAANQAGYLEVAMDAAELLLTQARPSEVGLPDAGFSNNGALVWPRQVGDTPPGLQAHCHGAGGIGQFFLRLDRLAPDARYREAAKGAARTITALRERETRSCVCHGLSGTGSFLLDCHQSLVGMHWLALASECGARLQGFRQPEQGGVYAMSIDGPVAPDLMLGYAGVGSFLLRLANPDTAREIILC